MKTNRRTTHRQRSRIRRASSLSAMLIAANLSGQASAQTAAPPVDAAVPAATAGTTATAASAASTDAAPAAAAGIQPASAIQPAAPAGQNRVVVTGTRLINRGFLAPTPVTTVDQQ